MYPGSCAERSNGGVEQQQHARLSRHERRADGIHRALGEADRDGARQHRPRLRDGVDRAVVVLGGSERHAVVVISAAVPLAVPRSFQHARARRRASLRYRSPRTSSFCRWHRSANSLRMVCRKKPSHVLSPRPSGPTRFMPSFQSPAPMSGSPCAPIVRPLSIARTQCSKRVPSSDEMRRQAVRFVRANREHRRFQKGHALVQDAGVACRADVFGDHEGQPQQIVRAAASAGRGHSVRATSAERRPRRTDGRQRGADAPWRAPAGPATTP